MPPERSTVDRASALSPFYLGQPAHPSRGQKKYPDVALDRAGITVFRDTASLQPARQVNAVVRQRKTREQTLTHSTTRFWKGPIMSLKVFAVLITVIALSVAGTVSAQEKEDKTDKTADAKKLSTQFAKAMFADKDSPGVMKLVAV